MLSAAIREFIRNHQNDDLHRLLLSAQRYTDIPVPLAVAQIEALRKVRDKIPAWHRFDLVFPPVLSVEQASSGETARFKAGLFSGKRMVDLTGGMGVDAYFFSRHFEQVIYVEQNPELAALARHNFGVLGAANIAVVESAAEDFLKQNPEPFDLLYLDPARRDGQQRRVFQLTDCQPNVPQIKDLLLTRSSRVLVKTAPLLDLKAAAEQLGDVTRIWVVSVENEVKEVLYLLEAPDRSTPPPFEKIPVEAVCLGEHQQRFSFTRAEEQAAVPRYSEPLAYLYEPDAAVLKAGAFKCFAQRFGLAKLHPHTHLYTSEKLVPDVPGRVFRVDVVTRYDRKAVQEAITGGRANVAARNFPDSVEAVRKKLGLKDGGAVFVFAATVGEEKRVIVCEKVE